LPADYDRTCAHIPREESDDKAAKGYAHVIRLKAPDNYPVFNDLVYGHVRSRKETRLKPLPRGSAKGSFDDPIIMKTDGFPTYHLANVVDDHLMDITHVIRGSEWMSSTPKHLALYQAFNWQPPFFAHVGLLLDKNRQKLSKRNAAIDIRSWRDRGIFPETLTNFVALLGWSHNTGQDVMSMEDLIHNASMKYTRGDTIVGFEKLPFLQKRHAGRYASSPPSANPLHDLRNLATKPMIGLLEKRLLDEELPFYATFRTPRAKEDYVHRILIADAANYKYPGDFIDRNLCFFIAPSATQLRNTLPSFRLRAVPSFIPPSPDLNLFFQLLSQIRDTPDEEWNRKVLKEKVSWVIETGKETSMRDLGMEALEDEGLEKRVKGAWSKLVHGYFRWALVGGNPGPDGVEMMCIMGREECERRLGVAEGLARDMEADRFESEEAKAVGDERATEAKRKDEDLDY
jgi:glutamyl-tRNA synthetase